MKLCTTLILITFQSLTFIVSGQNSLKNTETDTAFVEDNDEVFVGYGSMKRSRITGAISTIRTEDISGIQLPNFIEALRGQVPGLQITRKEGTPGSDVDFRINGSGSLIGRIYLNSVLIVIDGITYTGKVSDINPYDIVGIEILKDVASSSIFGSDAINGVICIKTKNGFSGKPAFNIDYSQGFTELIKKPELYNGKEYAQFKIDASEGRQMNNFPITPESVLDPIELINFRSGKYIDWHDELLRKG